MGPSPTTRHIKVTSGSLPSPKIHTLAACHPFSQQLDIVLPAPPGSSLCAALEGLEAGYGKAKARLSDVIEGACEFVNTESKLLAVSANQHNDNAWCVDARGHLTLSVAKETYERLGLVGKPLPFKGYEDRHTIDIPLHKSAQSPVVQARVKAAAEIWDRGLPNELGGREAGVWDVVYCWNDRETPQTNPFQDGQWHRVQCTKNQLQSVHVPVPSLSPQPSISTKTKSRQSQTSAQDDAEALDEWNRRTLSLFEWVGMACLGAQRLNANDRVDPYVALYTPPTPSRVGNVMHLRWRGLLSPSFIQDVLNTIIQSLHLTPSTSSDPSNIPNFVSVTVHALTSAPISYLPYSQSTTDGGALQPPLPEKVPLKAPNAAGEDTWSLVLEPQSDGLKWCLAESVGPGDARWG